MRAVILGFLWLALSCWGGSVVAADGGRAMTVIPAGGGGTAIRAAFDLLKDPSHRLTIADVATGAAARRFVPAEANDVHIGFSRSAWWGRFSLRNPTAESVVQVIEFDYPVIDRLEFYRPLPGGEGDAAGYRRQVTGDSTVDRSVDIPGRKVAYRVTVPPEGTATYYVRLSGDSILVFDATLWDRDSYYAGIAASLDSSVLFFGLVLAAAFYSFAIFIIVRDEAYLLFALAVVGVTGYFASIWGYMSAYVLPETTWAANFTVTASNCLILFALTRFASFFLHLADHMPRADKFLGILQVASGLALPLSLIDFQVANFFLRLLSFGGVAISLWFSLWLWRSGQRYGKFLAASWGYFGCISLIFVMERLGILPWPHVFETVFRITFAILSMMFVALFAAKYRHMTAQKEIELRAARDEAIAASQAKSRFLAMMSHELRTPLNAVIGFSDILRMETMGPLGNPKYKEYVQDIKDAGSHLLTIINDLLEISRIEAGQVELDEGPVVIEGLVRRCLRIVEERARQNDLTLEIRMPDALPELIADETRIQQVLINLLYNAVKFTPPGGRVTFEVAVTEQNEYRLAVRDTGIGIAAEDRARILEPFTQVASYLTRKHDGVGLGLAIAKSILELHGARLEVAGAVGEGTTFSVLFPSSRVAWQGA